MSRRGRWTRVVRSARALALRAPFGRAHNGLRLATGPLSGGLIMFVYGLHTHRRFDMAVGSGTNEPVNHKRAVHQRVGEFWGLLSGSGREHIRSRPQPILSDSEQRVRRQEGGSPKLLGDTQKRRAPRTFILGAPVLRKRTLGGAGQKLAPAAGLEPATKWLTATYSTIELRRSVSAQIQAQTTAFCGICQPPCRPSPGPPALSAAPPPLSPEAR